MKCIFNIGLKIEDEVFCGWASSISVLTATEKELGIMLLDIGGGTGKFAIPMSQDGLDVTLLEPSPGMRKGAQINLEKAKKSLRGKVRVVNGESKHLDFPEASFDLLFSKGAIHHNLWEGIRQSFREVKRVLRLGGIFIFQGRSTKDFALLDAERIQDTGITAKDKKGWKKGVIQHYFTKEELEQLAKENGFEIVVESEERIKEDGNARWWVVYRKI